MRAGEGKERSDRTIRRKPGQGRKGQEKTRKVMLKGLKCGVRGQGKLRQGKDEKDKRG